MKAASNDKTAFDLNKILQPNQNALKQEYAVVAINLKTITGEKPLKTD